MGKTIKDIGEFELIDRISKGCVIRTDRIVKAIGDDAAAFTIAPEQVILVTTDLLIERIHFIKSATSGFNLGYKALAVNLSDIAAMGGTALEAFVSIGVPATCEIGFIDDFYRGLKSLAAEFDVNILGGDTTGSKVDLVINIAVVGSVKPDKLLTRDRAQAGDIIFSTGFLGDSRAGLHLIGNPDLPDSETWARLRRAHLLPRPHLHEGRFLGSQEGVHAAIDVSDGLSSDLGHILAASDKGARLTAAQIPISKSLQRFCEQFDFEPVAYALAGGEDYTLLCTIAPDRAKPVTRDYLERFRQPLYPIGVVTPAGPMEIVLLDGQVSALKPSGWNHFKKDLES